MFKLEDLLGMVFWFELKHITSFCHFSAWSREKGEEDNSGSGLRMLGSSGDQLRCSGSLSKETEVQSCKYGSITPRAVHDLFSFFLLLF